MTLHRSDPTDDDFLDLSEEMAKNSKHPFVKAGACVVAPDGYVVTTGYTTAEESAEINAIMGNDDDLTGCDLYVTHFYPTDDTLHIIREEGIKRIIAYAPAIDAHPDFVLHVAKFCAKHNIRWTRVFKIIVDPNNF